MNIKDQAVLVPSNTMVLDPQELLKIPLKLGQNVYVRDVGKVSDSTDIPTGYALVNGKKSVYLPVVKRAEASTLDVVNAVKANMERFRSVLPDDVELTYEFDESPIVYRAIDSVGMEGLLGAGLTGLMVLVFLRDIRSVIVVVLNIPLALLGAVIVLQLTGNTVNIMTLGGLALAIGILVDEATVEIENIHTQMEHTAVDRPGRSARGTWRRPSRGSWPCSASSRSSSLRSSCRGRCAFTVRAALAGRRRLDGDVVPALQHARAGPERLADPGGTSTTTASAEQKKGFFSQGPGRVST